ncbi:class I SAM-dependent methyltransferase [Nocardia sp. NPDC059246]|uniref:class I SAM-dependent methyltransferase n=1 Tax=Nocardia sp. NPDC059246 TaxID=3346789 RepID=UPI0036BF41CE
MHGIFQKVAGYYDRMNAIMTLGRHRRWCREVAERAAPPAGGSLLDLATGTGVIALQMAADHPDAVRTLTVASSGDALSEAARTAQMNYASALAAGRRGLHHLAPAVSGSRILAGFASVVMWLADPLLRPACAADAVAFLRAEDVFDIGARLGDITAPTLVIGGDRDTGYPVETFRRTAAGIPGARLIIYPGATHMGVIRHARFAEDVASFTATCPRRHSRR